MKLTEAYFIPQITDAGVAELYSYVDSVLYKHSLNIPRTQLEDVRQEMVLKCIEKLKVYDCSRGIPLGGYLYWQCRGVISTWANHNRREVPASPSRIASLDAQHKFGIF